MRRIIVFTIITLSLVASSAMAESINGRLGLTGKAGFIVPLKDLVDNSGGELGEHSTGFAGGGGLIYGLGDNFALEADVTHAPSTEVKFRGIKIDQQTTDFSLGLQYRIMPAHHLVPYVGLGADFIKGDIENSTIDWTYGGHVNGGLDYFLNKSIAVVADFKFVFGVKSDITNNNVTIGKYDPMSFVGTFGVRLFLPE